MTLYDHIQELRAELANCIMTPAERASVEIELAEALAEQANRCTVRPSPCGHPRRGGARLTGALARLCDAVPAHGIPIRVACALSDAVTLSGSERATRLIGTECPFLLLARHRRIVVVVSARSNTTLADSLTPLLVANPFSAMRTSLRWWSSDEFEDGVAHGW